MRSRWLTFIFIYRYDRTYNTEHVSTVERSWSTILESPGTTKFKRRFILSLNMISDATVAQDKAGLIGTRRFITQYQGVHNTSSTNGFVNSSRGIKTLLASDGIGHC